MWCIFNQRLCFVSSSPSVAGLLGPYYDFIIFYTVLLPCACEIIGTWKQFMYMCISGVRKTRGFNSSCSWSNERMRRAFEVLNIIKRVWKRFLYIQQKLILFLRDVVNDKESFSFEIMISNEGIGRNEKREPNWTCGPPITPHPPLLPLIRFLMRSKAEQQPFIPRATLLSWAWFFFI